MRVCLVRSSPRNYAALVFIILVIRKTNAYSFNQAHLLHVLAASYSYHQQHISRLTSLRSKRTSGYFTQCLLNAAGASHAKYEYRIR